MPCQAAGCSTAPLPQLQHSRKASSSLCTHPTGSALDAWHCPRAASSCRQGYLWEREETEDFFRPTEMKVIFVRGFRKTIKGFSFSNDAGLAQV